MDNKTIYVFLADGFELVEAMTPVDVLRRGGLTVKTVSITGKELVDSANGVSVKADMLFDEAKIQNASWIVLPGGMPGAVNLYEFEPLKKIINDQYNSKDGRIAAICASPSVVLGQMGLLKGREAICYPGMEEHLAGSTLANTGFTVDERFVLGAGPSLALPWSLAILTEAAGLEVAQTVAEGMLVNRY